MIKFGATISFALLMLITACGGGNSGSDAGQLSIEITDASVDSVTEVWVEFTGITVKPKEGAALEFTFDNPISVDLKSLTNENTAILLDNEDVPAGDYNWIRLHVNAEFDNVMDSYVVSDDETQIELRVPSGAQSGLKLGNHFTVTANQSTSFVIDWNLRMGLTDPEGQPGYMLMPSLRIVDMTEHGSIAGTVNGALITDSSCTNDLNSGKDNVVYVFEGANVIPGDIDGVVPDPLTTGEVQLNSVSGDYEYRVPVLSPGEYTIAFTCQANDDHIPVDDPPPGFDPNDNIQFTLGMNAVVVVDETMIVNF